MPRTQVCDLLGIEHPILSVGFAAAAGPDGYKQRVVEAGAEDAFYSEDLFDVFWPGVPHRALKGPYVRGMARGRPAAVGRAAARGRGDRVPPLPVPRGRGAALRLVHADAVVRGRDRARPMWAGESVALVDAVLPAGEIVRRIAAEADEVLAAVARQV